MFELGAIVDKIRSKNAGPFWLTIDIFCGSAQVYDRVSQNLRTDQIAAAFQVDVATIKRFDMAQLHVVKFSLPRPVIQGVAADRDMHGAGWGPLVSEIRID